MNEFIEGLKIYYPVIPLAALGISLILREITDYYNRKGRR